MMAKFRVFTTDCGREYAVVPRKGKRRGFARDRVATFQTTENQTPDRFASGSLCHASSGPRRDLRVDRNLLQPGAAPQRPRLSIPCGLRNPTQLKTNPMPHAFIHCPSNRGKASRDPARERSGLEVVRSGQFRVFTLTRWLNRIGLRPRVQYPGGDCHV